MFRRWWRKFRADAFGTLPERVQELINTEHRGAGILAAWIHMGIVLFFGLLYAVSPKSLAILDLTYLWCRAG